MKNKTVGLILLSIYGINVVFNYILFLTWYGEYGARMTPLSWIGTVVMIILFVGGVYYLVKEEE